MLLRNIELASCGSVASFCVRTCKSPPWTPLGRHHHSQSAFPSFSDHIETILTDSFRALASRQQASSLPIFRKSDQAEPKHEHEYTPESKHDHLSKSSITSFIDMHPVLS